jgi:hypothetical protein
LTCDNCMPPHSARGLRPPRHVVSAARRPMIAVGVAVTWIAISAAGAKGLAVFARAAAATDLEAELAMLAVEGRFGNDGYPVEAETRLAGKRL